MSTLDTSTSLTYDPINGLVSGGITSAVPIVGINALNTWDAKQHAKQMKMEEVDCFDSNIRLR